MGIREIRKSYNRLGWSMLAYMAIYQFMSLPFLLLVKQFWPELLSKTWFNLILNEVIQYGIALPVAVLIMNSAKAPKPQEVRPQRKYRLSAGEFLHYLILSIGLLFLFNIVGTYLNYLISIVKGSQAGNIVEQSLTVEPYMSWEWHMQKERDAMVIQETKEVLQQRIKKHI